MKIIALFFLISTAFCTPDGLTVLFDVHGETVSVLMTRPESQKYVLDFVAGRAPSTLPASVLSELRAASVAPDLGGARILRATACRAGSCLPLKGLYAGRSPF